MSAKMTNGAPGNEPPISGRSFAKRIFLTLTGILLAVIAAWVVWSGQSITLRYRLTITVDDNGQAVSGSSVIQTVWGGVGEYFPSMNVISGGRWKPLVKAQALSVDLGTRGTLFMLLDWDQFRPTNDTSSSTPTNLLVAAFGSPGIGNATWQLLRHIQKSRQAVVVPIFQLPLLVRFRDINDPKSVEHVDPFDLEASFGSGVKLVGVSLQMTTDPVSTGIENTLPWLRSLGSRNLAGTELTGPGLAGSLGYLSFKQDEE